MRKGETKMRLDVLRLTRLSSPGTMADLRFYTVDVS